MKFSNEELKEHFLDKLSQNHNMKIKCLSANDEEVHITSNERVETIAFDEKENVSIMFFGYQTSIFAYDIEIMFIDEDSKGTYTSSDVYDNVVYEGNMRAMSHEEMLHMFVEIVLCFAGAEQVSMTQLDDLDNKYKRYNYYRPHIFVVEVKNNHTTPKMSVYENITIKY
ncbi:MAG: hypothetical protein NC413_12940 [Muribaculum sp.]|nr:hypothetical protein [Muribaculum sp.]